MLSEKPDCPGNPLDYILVNSKEGKYWRRKRGTVVTARLNDALEENTELMKIIAPAAKRIKDCLRPFMHGIEPGRLKVRFEGPLRTSFKEINTMQFSYFKGLQIQDNHPLERMYNAYSIRINNSAIYIDLVLSRELIIAQNAIATEYYFDAILVFGDINNERGLKTDSMESPVYSFHSSKKSKCSLSFPLPQKADWMVILKLSCLEGNEIAMNTKHYRMGVVAVKR
jgi:hypothetical protein